MEACHQAEQANPYQHVQPAGAVAHHGFHRLGQWVVDVREGAPVTHPASEEHHAHGQDHQGEDAADVGLRNGALGVLGFFGGHGRAFDGEEEPDREGDGGKHTGNRRGTEGVGTGPAIEGKIAEAERRGDYAHEYQQFGDGQHADHQLKGGGKFHPEDIQAHEHDICTDGGVLGVECRELHVQVRANGQGNRGRGEDEFDQSGQAGNQAAFLTEGATAVGKGASGVGNRSGQFGEAEDKAGVHRGDH